MRTKIADVKMLSLTALLAAVVFVFTVVIAISIPTTGGFWNIGEAGVYLAAFIGGPIVGALAGGIGSALADLFLGYPEYAPGTLIIKAVEGFVVGYLYLLLMRSEESQKQKMLLILVILAIFGVTLLSYFYIYLEVGEGYIEILLESKPLALTIQTRISIWVLLSFVIIVEILALLLLLWGGETHIMIFSCMIGGTLMVFGYFLYETLILGGAAALVEVIPNFFQAIIGAAISIPTIRRLREMGILDRIKEFMGQVSESG